MVAAMSSDLLATYLKLQICSSIFGVFTGVGTRIRGRLKIEEEEGGRGKKIIL